MNGAPICGWPWFLKHRKDYTQADIDNQTIVVSSGSFKLPAIRAGTAGKVVKDILQGINK